MYLVEHVLEFNRIRHMAYVRMTRLEGMSMEIAQRAFCVLLWMETVLGANLLHEVAKTSTTSDATVTSLVLEADAVHDFTIFGCDLPEGVEGIPSLVSICGEGRPRLLDFRFFRFHRDLVGRGLTAIRHGVPALIFDEGLQTMMREHRLALGPRASYAPPPDLIKPYVVKRTTPPRDSRSAFIFFVGGQPITTEEITAYFEKGQAGCVERTAVEDASTVEQDETPYHGIIVFLEASLRDTVMGLENWANFDINGKRMRLQVYRPPD